MVGEAGGPLWTADSEYGGQELSIDMQYYQVYNQQALTSACYYILH